jgi:F-type H+-transporting ATPase subunit a
VGEHPGTWYNALEGLLPESWRHVINPQVMASWTVMFFLAVAILVGTRRMRKVPRGWQNLWEWTYEVFRHFAIGVMGPVGEKYMAFLATCFIYIFCCNVLGIIPGFISPTTSINMTAALALTVFVYVQYSGLRAHRLGYFKHFVGDPAWMFFLNIPIHIIGELAKPLSLSIRLFGNIFGEETVVTQLAHMGAVIQQAIVVPIPIHLIMVAFAIFGGFIQALIFTMLTAVYISMAVAHEPGHGEQHAPADEHAQAEQPALV